MVSAIRVRIRFGVIKANSPRASRGQRHPEIRSQDK
jgi:hypothetical protein